MENDEWICCNCGVVTLDRNGRCPICRTDNVAPLHNPGVLPPSPPHLEEFRVDKGKSQ